jgi:hypothetical protein
MLDHNWKRNLRKIPDAVKERVGGFDDDTVVVACAKKIPIADLQNGTYAHLGLRADEHGEFQSPSSVIPPSGSGRYSKWNVEGREIVHDDRPKIRKTYSWETPNFGDWSKGSHMVHMERMVYPRTQVPPRNLRIDVEILGREVLDEEAFAVKFVVNKQLDRRTADFEDELLFTLNLLQENVGHTDVYPAEAQDERYLDSLFVDWEILPPGTEDHDVERILSGVNGESSGKREELMERYEVLADLNPQTYVQGRDGFRRYFGAKFSDDLVVFENVRYGNALYVMYDNWEELSRKSRIELLKNHRDEFDRIEHRDGWKNRLRGLIKTNGLGSGGSIS